MNGIFTSALIHAQVTVMLAMTSHRRTKFILRFDTYR